MTLASRLDFREHRFRLGSDDAARVDFHRMLTALIQVRHPTATEVRANPGDWGIDTFVGSLVDKINIWQSKYFPDGIDKSQKDQVRESLVSAMDHARKHGYMVETWTLCVPCDLDAPERKWWDGRCKAWTKEFPGTNFDLWDAPRLRGMLMLADAAHVLQEFYGPARVWETTAQLLTAASPLHHLPAATRVQDSRPRLLGVHASIQVAGADGELPPYVARDLDLALRSAVTAAAENGGFVLLVGGSSVGKTRALFEAVRAALPEWWLLHPADTDTIRGYAMAPTPRTVLWLDELQSYLNQPRRLPAGVVRDLIAAGTVLLGTLWPNEYHARIAPRTVGETRRQANDRELLGLAQILDVPAAFSTEERRRGETLATDPRIRTALSSTDAGFTQVLAAGPELVRWWEQASDPYGKAVITAALDARRVGADAPLTRAFLEVAAVGYLTPAQQASARADWLDQAMTYATTQLHGAAAALVPVPASLGHIAGYTTADYLHQHALRARRTTHLPTAAWQALIDHHDPSDTINLAYSAERRGQHATAEAFYRSLDDDSNSYVVVMIAVATAAQGRHDEALKILRPLADAGDPAAADELAELLMQLDQVEELQQRAEAGDNSAAEVLVEFLAAHHRIDDLYQLVSAGDTYAGELLVHLLVEQGRIEDAIAVSRQHADAGDKYAAARLADLLAEHGFTDELRHRASTGDPRAMKRLESLRILDAIIDKPALWRQDPKDEFVLKRLVQSLTKQGRTEEAITMLQRRADAHGWPPSRMLVQLLIQQGRTQEAITMLQHRADADDLMAAELLVDLLVEQRRISELQDEVAAGTRGAAKHLIELRTERSMSRDRAARLVL
ncbi:hypothetical protein ACFPIJ_48270 [Dactylosporangium cerinum]|uniref:Uncharacterized protein n=1 Tax=Dactylosporangium cerinum TaxID=1434730 RepID=A0ABV9WC25_9ACTN